VTIMVPWSGGEFDAFYRVIKQFKNNEKKMDEMK